MSAPVSPAWATQARNSRNDAVKSAARVVRHARAPRIERFPKKCTLYPFVKKKLDAHDPADRTERFVAVRIQTAEALNTVRTRKIDFTTNTSKRPDTRKRLFATHDPAAGNRTRILLFRTDSDKSRLIIYSELNVANILIIDDDQDFSRSFQRIIERMGHPCSIAHDIKDAFTQIGSMDCDLIFLDVNLPDGNGLAHIKQFQSFPSLPEVVILTGDGDSDGAALAIANGAWDYVGKPISLNNIKLMLQRTVAYRASKELSKQHRAVKRSAIIGESAKMLASLEIMGKAAGSKSNVIITGETGTGKELFARGIHENSATPGKLVVIDCTNLSAQLAESTLFGHTKGSFTSAHDSRDGLFKLADNGTVFLDEIAELNLDLQKSLLRVLQERKFRPIGSEKEISSNFRVIAATNKDLRVMVDQGLFRNDLYYRLNGHHIHIPPLRERKEDITLLAEYYTDKLCRENKSGGKSLTPDFLDALHAYHWPGNVREFVNTIAVAVDNAMDEPCLYSHHLSIDIRITIAKNSFRHMPDKEQPILLEPGQLHNAIPLPFAQGEDLPPLRDAREAVVSQLENTYMRQLLGLCANDVPSACERSGLSRARLYELLKKHSIRLK